MLDRIARIRTRLVEVKVPLWYCFLMLGVCWVILIGQLYVSAQLRRQLVETRANFHKLTEEVGQTCLDAIQRSRS